MIDLNEKLATHKTRLEFSDSSYVKCSQCACSTHVVWWIGWFRHCQYFHLFQVGHKGDLPGSVDQDFEANEDFLKKAHHVLLEVSFSENVPNTCI